MKKHHKLIFVITILFIFTLIYAPRLLSNKSIIIGSTPYFYLDLAEAYSQKSNILENNFINPHQIIIMILTLLIGKLALIVLPLILNTLSAILLFKILSKFQFSHYEKLASVIILITSPIIINTLAVSDIFSTAFS